MKDKNIEYGERAIFRNPLVYDMFGQTVTIPIGQHIIITETVFVDGHPHVVGKLIGGDYDGVGVAFCNDCQFAATMMMLEDFGEDGKYEHDSWLNEEDVLYTLDKPE